MFMVGLCGVAGIHHHDIDDMIKKLIYLGDEKSYKYFDSNIKIGSVFFKDSCEKQPAFTSDNSLLWLWGDLYGFDGPDGYIPKDDVHISNVDYCVKLYNKNGIEFITGLNGLFAGILYNQDKKVISLFTDRLSTHPIFFTKTKEDILVFSTQIQSIPFYPSVDANFDLNYLTHFFTFEKVFGVKTVLKNVEQIHPGSILSYDLKQGNVDKKIYWCPKYEPKKRSSTNIVKEFTNLFRTIIKETIDENLTYGLYLSGGSDSRLIAAMIKNVYPNITLICYHMNEWMNREAKIAKKVAEICNCEFKLLKRTDDFQFKVLQHVAPISAFDSWFDHAHYIVFNNETSEEVDVMLHGFYCDVMLKRYHLLLKSITIPKIKQHIYLPSYYNIRSIDEFLRLFSIGYGHTSRDGKIPNYLKTDNKEKILSFLKNEFIENKIGINFSGIQYYSFEDFLHWRGIYPITQSGYILFSSELQSNTSFTPFLDNRLIDFTVSIPDDFFLRNNLINRTIKMINPDLSSIPHADSNLPIKYPKLFHFFYDQLNVAKSKLFPKEKWQGSWGNIEEILRNQNFVKEIIYKNEKLIRRCTFLDWNEVEKCYLDHIKGINNTNQLIPLLTFLENNITEYLINKH